MLWRASRPAGEPDRQGEVRQNIHAAPPAVTDAPRSKFDRVAFLALQAEGPAKLGRGCDGNRNDAWLAPNRFGNREASEALDATRVE